MKGAIELACNNNDREKRRRHCGCMRMARGCWGNFPYYGGPCPDTCGCYGRRPCEDTDSDNGGDDDDCTCRRRRRRRCGPPNALFTAYTPIMVSANGIVPLALSDTTRDRMFDTNCGLITVEAPGTYLATYKVNVPAGTTMETLLTLNVNGACQSPATENVVADGGSSSLNYTAQAIFEADEGDTVSLRKIGRAHV